MDDIASDPNQHQISCPACLQPFRDAFSLCSHLNDTNSLCHSQAQEVLAQLALTQRMFEEPGGTFNLYSRFMFVAHFVLDRRGYTIPLLYL